MLTGMRVPSGEREHPPLTTSQSGATPLDSLGENLIFLISQPRAGSTLLQKVLASNPQIHTLSEPWIGLNPIFALRPSGWTADFDATLARSAIEEFLRQIPEGEEAYWCAVRGMLNDLYRRALGVSGKQIFLDKTPRYYFVIPELRRIFPRARFIFLLRNPLAVLSSILNTWVKSDNPLALRPARHDLMLAPQLLLEGMRQHGPNTLVVRYEDLVLNPHAEIPRLCDGLGIPFQEDMIEYGAAAGQSRWLYGDQGTVYRENRPIAEFALRWPAMLKNSETWSRWARAYLEALGPDLVTELGYDYSQLSVDFPSPAATLDWQAATESDDEAEARLHAQFQQAAETIRAQHERSASLEIAARERLSALDRKQKELEEITADAERRRQELERAMQVVAERDLRIASLEEIAAEGLICIHSRDREIEVREQRIAALESAAADRLVAMLDRDREIQMREERIALLETAAAERLAAIEDKDRLINRLASELSETIERADTEKKSVVSGLTARIGVLESALAGRDELATVLEGAAAQRLAEMHEKDRCIAGLAAELERLRKRSIFPFRGLGKR